MKRIRRYGKDQGSAAVEFALVLPVLMLVLFGIIDLGRMLNARIVLSQAAHEGARALAVTANEDTAGAIIDRVMGSMSSGTATDIEGCDSPFGGEATVTVTYQFVFATPLAILVGIGDGEGMELTSTAVVPCL